MRFRSSQTKKKKRPAPAPSTKRKRVRRRKTPRGGGAKRAGQSQVYDEFMESRVLAASLHRMPLLNHLTAELIRLVVTSTWNKGTYPVESVIESLQARRPFIAGFVDIKHLSYDEIQRLHAFNMRVIALALYFVAITGVDLPDQPNGTVVRSKSRQKDFEVMKDGSYVAIPPHSRSAWKTKTMAMPSDLCCLKESVLNGANISIPERDYIRRKLGNLNWSSKNDYIPWFPGGFTVEVVNSDQCHIGSRKCPRKGRMVSGPSGTSWRALCGLLYHLHTNKKLADALRSSDPMYLAALSLIAWLGPQGDHSITEIITSCYMVRLHEWRTYGQLKWCKSCIYFIDPLTDPRMLHHIVSRCKASLEG